MFFSQICLTAGGRGGIRTRGTLRFGSLAKTCLKPLSHSSKLAEEVGFEPTHPFQDDHPLPTEYITRLCHPSVLFPNSTTTTLQKSITTISFHAASSSSLSRSVRTLVLSNVVTPRTGFTHSWCCCVQFNNLYAHKFWRKIRELNPGTIHHRGLRFRNGRITTLPIFQIQIIIYRLQHGLQILQAARSCPSPRSFSNHKSIRSDALGHIV